MASFPRLGRHPGMQIHAVPEAERAIDATGRKLPWSYSHLPAAAQSPFLASLDPGPVERGPFGRTTRRRQATSRSRSKTLDVHSRRETEEEKAGKENVEREDAIFGKLTRRTETADSKGTSRDILVEIEQNAPAAVAQRAAVGFDDQGDATEVLLWGFGAEAQWAALDFYERVSGGAVLEDYPRTPLGANIDTARNYGRQQAVGRLSRAALRKRNCYAGGAHWVKVTFDSRLSADNACAKSPHSLHGHTIHAEIWRGVGPLRDEPSLEIPGESQSLNGSFVSSTTTTIGVKNSPQSSVTASSATATGPPADRGEMQGEHKSIPLGLRAMFGFSDTPTAAVPDREPEPHQLNDRQQRQVLVPGTASPSTTQRRTIGRIDGARVAALLPAEAALMPKQAPSYAGTFGTFLSFLTLSWFFGFFGADGMIGSTIPRKDDGSFDWEKSGPYWRMFAWLDALFGTDFCGLKTEE